MQFDWEKIQYQKEVFAHESKFNSLTVILFWFFCSFSAAFVPRGDNPGEFDEAHWQKELKAVRSIS